MQINSSGARLKLSLLGPFQAILDGECLGGFRSAKVRALLSYLAVESQRSWPRMLLADLLWPNLPEENALSNLRNAISNLRKVIGDQNRESPILLVSQDTLQFNQENSTWLDVRAFLGLIHSTKHKDGEGLYKEDITSLEQALELYRGDFMEDIFINSAPFEDWVLRTSQHLKRKAVEAHQLLVQGCLEIENLDPALEYARRWVELDPIDEKGQSHLIQILASMGRRNEALIQYEDYRQLLKEELGVDPAVETRDLYDQIRSGKLDQPKEKQKTFLHFQTEQIPDFLKDSQIYETDDSFFVARTKELEHLDHELEKSIEGHGRIVFAVGEPGSGKSALLAEFVRRSIKKIPDLIVAQGQCNAYTGEADPYSPFLEIIKTLCGDLESRVLGGELKPEHATRLWRFLPQVINTIYEEGPELINRFISARELLLTAETISGIKPEALSYFQTQSAGSSQKPIKTSSQKAALLNRVAEVLCLLSFHQPIILVIDDLQWIDTDSVNLLFHLGRGISSSRILLLGAYRPEEVEIGRQGKRHPLVGLVHELQMIHGDIHIDLGKSEAFDFVDSLLDREPNQFNPIFRDQLIRHTSGHPLFTIELLRGMQIRGDITRNKQGQWIEGKQLNWDKLPARVEAVISERIEQLQPDYRELLRTASVQGEHFTAEILAEILGAESSEVIQTLSRVIGKRHRLVLAQRRGHVRRKTRSQYRFHHILFQKYLYQQMDEIEKAQLHEKTGTALEAYYRKDLNNYPEITPQLARHYHLAGRLKKAAKYYADSGNYALRLGAHGEAINHFKQALQLVKGFPESGQRDQQALNLHLRLGPLLTATQGWAAPELEENYQQAEELCKKMGDNAQLVPALWLVAVFRLGRAEHAAVDKLVSRLYTLAQNIGDADLLCLADLQVSPLYQGQLNKARKLLTHASLPRDIEQQRSLAIHYGMSPSVIALAYLANCLWLMGLPEEAAQRIQEACDLAAEINAPMTTCYAVSRLTWQHTLTGEIESIPKAASTLLQISQEHELRSFEQAAIFFLEWHKHQTTDRSVERIKTMWAAIEEYKKLGTLLNRTYFLILFADACEKAGRVKRGLDALDEAIKLGQETGERWFEAEAYRLKGELLAIKSEDLLSADNSFEMARKTANCQGAKMLELRAVTSQAYLLQKMGKKKEAIQILTDMLSHFSKDVICQDIQNAKVLLGELEN